MGGPYLPRELSRHLVPVMDMRHGFPGASIWRILGDLTLNAGLGGVLLRGGDRQTWEQAVRRLSDLGEARPLILADFEQGAASQISGVPWLPKQFSIGATHEPRDAETLGKLVGRQAREFGVDLVLAPVADLYVEAGNPATGARCFGATPLRVARNVAAFIQGCQNEGIGAVAKHFPGHGRTVEDSHISMPRITVRRDTWFLSDCLPFKEAIRTNVTGIMVGHLWVSCLDPLAIRPASLSPVIMRDLLRNELGFSGAVLTDSFEMGAVSDAGMHAVQHALASGADLVIGPRIAELMEAQAPVGTPAREDAADRVTMTLDGIAQSFGLDVAQRSVAWIGKKTMVVGDPHGIEMIIVLTSDARDDRRLVETFLDEVIARNPTCAIRHSTGDDGGDFAGKIAVIVVISKWERQITSRVILEIVAHVAASARSVILVLLGAVDTATIAPEDSPTLLTGDATTYSQIAAVRVIFGEATATGSPDLPSAAVAALPRTGGNI